MTIWGRIWDGLKGRKAILGGCLIVLAAVLAVAFGRVSPEIGLLLVGAGMSVAGFADKFNRHQAELLAALKEAQRLGVDMRTEGKPLTAEALVVATQEAFTRQRVDYTVTTTGRGPNV